MEVKGKVTGGSGALSGLRVEAWDKDWLVDDMVGYATTDATGAFHIRLNKYSILDFIVDKNPDLYFRVYRGKRMIASTFANIKWNAKRIKNVKIDLGGGGTEEKEIMNEEAFDFFDNTEAEYTVRGTATTAFGAAVPRQRLVAFDVDLKGAAIYRTAQTMEEIETSEGFEFLGESLSDDAGIYAIEFTSSAFKNAERGKADVVVFAVKSGQVVGRSRLVNASDYNSENEILDLSVSVERDANHQSEYYKLYRRVDLFVSESDVTVAELSVSVDQMDFVASEVGMAKEQVYALVAAYHLLDGTTAEAILYRGMLYSLSRLGYQLNWTELMAQNDLDIVQDIGRAVSVNLIDVPSDQELEGFLKLIDQEGKMVLLDVTQEGIFDEKDFASDPLSIAFDNPEDKLAFVDAIRSHDASKSDFWTEHLLKQDAFANNPEKVDKLLFTNQVTMLSGRHQPLMVELQNNRGLKNPADLVALNPEDWNAIVDASGVPDYITGKDDAEKKMRYADQLQGLVNAAFPNLRIANMLEKDELVSPGELKSELQGFLSDENGFDIGTSRVVDFKSQIKAAAPDNFEKLEVELSSLQRLFQVSPNAHVLKTLQEANLTSAFQIFSMPEKTFVQAYSQMLGGPEFAYAVHQRAGYITSRSEQFAMNIMELHDENRVAGIWSEEDTVTFSTMLQNKIPNYTELFGSPDICECKQCRSVYSAAAYFVDLLRFLWRGTPNLLGKTPLDEFARRRPDLLELPLTCENTNTIIPYIDLVNEVLEYYTAFGKLDKDAAHDTGDATAAELRANPQNFEIKAYEKLKDQVYPFGLPYHQPLDSIRIYSKHLNVDRHEVMEVMRKDTLAANTRAIAAEKMELSQEEYTIIAQKNFADADDLTATHTYYGLSNANDLVTLLPVLKFLEASGMKYKELVELIKAKFINPNQDLINVIDRLFENERFYKVDAIYNQLKQIRDNDPAPAATTAITRALTGTGISYTDFVQWIKDNLNKIEEIITLYEPTSACDLETTRIRTIKRVFDSNLPDELPDATWKKIHRFIRLWRRLNMSIHEVDLMLSSLGQADITTDTVDQIGGLQAIRKKVRTPLNQLMTLWGKIDTDGKKPLYEKLFLNKAVQRIDDAFKPDYWGNYLTDTGETLGKHIPGILAAFHITSNDLDAIIDHARVKNGANKRKLVLATDILNLENLSIIYRYKVLAKATKLKIQDLCTLLDLFKLEPFSIWDEGAGKKRFENISTKTTLDAIVLLNQIRSARFKPATLAYIIKGTLESQSSLGLKTEKVHATLRTIRGVFATIKQEHPVKPLVAVTYESLANKMNLTFASTVVSKLMNVLKGTESFSAITTANLTITFPASVKQKASYVKATGRLTFNGVMSDDELVDMKAATGADTAFEKAADELYKAPEDFLKDNFSGMFGANEAQALATLLNHPKQATAPTEEKKLNYVYDRYIPLLHKKLRRDALISNMSSLIGLSLGATELLVKTNEAALLKAVDTTGFSTVFYSDAALTTAEEKANHKTINFKWDGASDPTLPGATIGAVWQAFIAPPVSGSFTFLVKVLKGDERFKLFLDGEEILEKLAANTTKSLEVVASLNASKMHAFKLELTGSGAGTGVQLFWKTDTMALEAVPATAAYPVVEAKQFSEEATLLNRGAKFINGFNLSDTEVKHFNTYGSDFDALNFRALTVTHWKRIDTYTRLRNTMPQAQASLVDVFELANKTKPAATLTEIIALISKASAWKLKLVTELVSTHFGWSEADFKNEVKLTHLAKVFKLINKTGATVSTLTEWAKAETDFKKLHRTAQVVKNSVKAKYEETAWLEIAGDLSDKLRTNQQKALIQYLLVQSELKAWGVKDANSLLEYFLIDVQMTACMDTSRIVQANAAIQFFISRCFLNLESVQLGGQWRIGADALDEERWKWMKNYRVWEANRKVFLYPENWLNPEWRDDRSPFFKELESELVQNDITERSTEAAFRNYLTKLDTVSRLEVVGTHMDMQSQVMHVFARTNTLPYQYFYRTRNKFRKWSAWEEVALDIRSVEGAGKSGVHLLPAVWKKRLFLFWLEFMEMEEPSLSSTEKSSKIRDLGGSSPNALMSKKRWEVRLAWSEYVDKIWDNKQLSKALFKPANHHSELKNYGANVLINASTGNMEVRLEDKNNKTTGLFIFDDVRSEKFASPTSSSSTKIVTTSYNNHYVKYQKTGSLKLNNDTYLKNTINHRILYSNQLGLPEATLLRFPFFYHDDTRSYFVGQQIKSVPAHIKDPFKLPPIITLPKPRVDLRWPPRNPFPDPRINGPIVLPGTDGPLGPIINEPDLPGVGGGMPPTGPGPGGFEPGNPGIPGLGPLVQDGGMLDDFVVSGTGFSSPYADLSLVTDALEEANLGGNAGPGSVFMMMTEATGDVLPTMYFRTHKIDKESSSWEMANASTTGGAMVQNGSGYKTAYPRRLWAMVDRVKLQFHTFYHPFTSKFTSNLNQYGVSGLMASDTSIPSDGGSTFINKYGPDFKFVDKPDDFKDRTYYKENVCFDPYGAMSGYNWELFFHTPLYIATRLSRNGKHKEAMKWFHYIFDPTTDELPLVGQKETARFWKVKPFKETTAKRLEDWFKKLQANNNPSSENDEIGEWRDNPFKPHLIARNRPVAYMKHVVLQYVQNLVDWGDQLFRRDTRESINEAIQLYVLAAHILGPRPQFVPKRGNIKAETFETLRNKLDDFSNALVQLENLFPYSSDIPVSSSGYGVGMLGAGKALYFCIPSNDKLLKHWDTVEDRLYKIRNCMNIDGVVRSLALFDPPIDPGALINALSKGLDLGSALSDLGSPPPIYRFNFLIGKTKDFVNEVKTLGNALLSALEKKDGEELARLRATHETAILKMVTSVKEHQLLEAKANKAGLEKGREVNKFRLKYYTELLGNEAMTDPGTTLLSGNINAKTRLPGDTLLPEVETDVDEALVESREAGIKLIAKEKEDIDKAKAAMVSQGVASAMEGLAGALSLIPSVAVMASPLGVGGKVEFGGQQLGAATSALAKVPQIVSQVLSFEAAQAAKTAGYIRREQEWTMQVNVAAKEIIKADKDILAADLRVKSLQKDLDSHLQQIKNAEAIEEFLKDKYTDQELYQWMKEQLVSVYKQSYNMAYAMARKAEKCYRYEVGTETANFIQYGYWDNSHQGLLSGEKLTLALNQLEKSYLEEYKRELELTKHFSMALLNPLALQQLKETGKANFKLLEEWFDLDFQGHYFRRVKSVSISIPCIAGPYTTVNCTLRLINNSLRINSDLSDGNYEHNNDEGVPTTDTRFRSVKVPVTSIATSSAQNDSGVFELNFRDERYLPFEGAGAISEWQLELTTNENLRQFDYSTMTDVVIHVNYMAREAGGQFKTKCAAHLKSFIEKELDSSPVPMMRMFDLKHEFPTEWNKFLYPTAVGGDQELKVKLVKGLFPFFTQHRTLDVKQIDILAKTTKSGAYTCLVSGTKEDGDPATSTAIPMPVNTTYGKMNVVPLKGTAHGLTIEDLDIHKELTIKLKKSDTPAGAGEYSSLATSPKEEVSDLFIVVHYALEVIPAAP